jgi:hypothetical protein
MDEAASRAGQDDWGDIGFTHPLTLLIEGCRETARLTPSGWDVLRRTILRHLSNRLALQGHMSTPGFSSRFPVQPLVVTGLPRTGTTLAHNLLAQDDHLRVLRLWEALRPAPPTALSPAERAETQRLRVRQAETWLERTYAMVPGLQAIHPATAEGPEECDVLLQNSFASLHFDDMWNAEQYSTWFATADLREEYRYYARQLALLAGTDDGLTRWLLKSPGHLGHLDALFEALPDAVIVQCHRHPAQAVASWASLVRAVRAPHTAVLDLEVVGRQALARAWRATERAMQVRDTRPQAFVDVSYERLVGRPAMVVTDVYDRLGRPLQPPAEGRMRRWLGDNLQHAHGPHNYGLDEFGLRFDEVAERFAPYLDRFGHLVEA